MYTHEGKNKKKQNQANHTLELQTITPTQIREPETVADLVLRVV